MNCQKNSGDLYGNSEKILNGKRAAKHELAQGLSPEILQNDSSPIIVQLKTDRLNHSIQVKAAKDLKFVSVSR
jgi:hypothetical protein